MTMQIAGAILIGLVLFGLIMATGKAMGYRLAAFIWGTAAVLTALLTLGPAMMSGAFGE